MKKIILSSLLVLFVISKQVAQKPYINPVCGTFLTSDTCSEACLWRQKSLGGPSGCLTGCDDVNNQKQCTSYGCKWNHGKCHRDCYGMKTEDPCYSMGCFWREVDKKFSCKFEKRSSSECKGKKNVKDCENFGCFWIKHQCKNKK